ncbi:MAG: hypothetical protein EBQ88_09800 [Betaproteobacteria bacterium]|nr:hypothetical protein [Betaproteobacteria bacterium]NBX96974.1 hypothetical protein [Betaproteobacteria bacterium]
MQARLGPLLAVDRVTGHGVAGLARLGCGFVAAVLLLAQLSACSPALDWRDVRAQAVGLTMLFPCKPQTQSRSLEVAGRPWSATLWACDAGGMTFAALALSPPDLEREALGQSPNRASMLLDLTKTAAARWGPMEGEQAAPPGVRLPPGVQAHWTRHVQPAQAAAAMQTWALFMATPQGVVQLSVHGDRLSDAALENFFGQLSVTP